jgi:hypothetical protein
VEKRPSLLSLTTSGLLRVSSRFIRLRETVTQPPSPRIPEPDFGPLQRGSSTQNHRMSTEDFSASNDSLDRVRHARLRSLSDSNLLSRLNSAANGSQESLPPHP